MLLVAIRPTLSCNCWLRAAAFELPLRHFVVSIKANSQLDSEIAALDAGRTFPANVPAKLNKRKTGTDVDGWIKKYVDESPWNLIAPVYFTFFSFPIVKLISTMCDINAGHIIHSIKY